MRDFNDIITDGIPRKAFSNGTSWEIWSSRWCEECINDINENCPLIAAAMFGDITPQEWAEVGLQNYECSEFQPREEQP